MTHPVPPGYPSRVTAYRRGIVIGLLLGLVALAGCSVEGRVQVRSAVAVDVDVTVRANRSPYCNADIVGLSTDPERGRGGVITSCRYRGTLDPSQLGWALGLASAVLWVNKPSSSGHLRLRSKDGIHFTLKGQHFLADHVAERIEFAAPPASASAAAVSCASFSL